MATSRRVSALPIPQAELDRLCSTLSPHYGGLVWEGNGARILVVRVPRPEPDLVNDIEQAVEYLGPADTQDLTAALLVGLERPVAVPTGPFRDLMARRVQTDHEQCQQLRQRIASESGHLAYRHPADPKGVLRLAVRVPHDHVQELGEEDHARWAAELGPQLESGRLAGVRAVYLIARRDDVRLDGDLFFQDLRERLADERERRRMAAQLVQRQAEAPPPPAPRVAYAPLKPAAAAQAARADPAAPPAEAPPPAAAGADPALAATRQALAGAGFDVLVRPKASHPVDLAAERAEGDVQRVIVRVAGRLTPELAREVLAASRALDVDLALAVCPEADPAARRAFIATKARWIHPEDLAGLSL